MIDPTEQPLRAPAINNPGLLSRDEIKRYFIARQGLLQLLVDDLKVDAPQHKLIIGTRGMGKTTLLHRLKCSIEDEPELNTKWIPLVFPEEQYNVTRLSDFYLNCLDALSDSLESLSETSHVQALDKLIDDLPKQQDSLLESSKKTLLSAVSMLNRGFVLLVDNADRILENFNEAEEWAFRELLSHESQIVMVGASARAVEATYDYGKPFYEFFQIHELKGLAFEETLDVLRGVADILDDEPVRQLLDGPKVRLKTLYTLTGGNPRTLILLYKIYANGIGGEVRTDLEQLLDVCSPLYKARVEELPEQSQQVLDALAIHWHPATAAEIAERARLKTETVSSQLTRLTRQGVVEKVADYPGARHAYQVAERFFNIWYLMRSSRRIRRRLLWLVEFLKMIYTQEELQNLALKNLSDTADLAPHAFKQEQDDHLRSVEYDLSLAQAIDDRHLSRALELSSLQKLSQSESLRKEVKELFDLEGEDAELRHDYQRIDLLTQCKKKILSADVDWGDWSAEECWELLGGSISFHPQEKLEVATRLADDDEESRQQLRKKLEEEFQEHARFYGDSGVTEALWQAMREGFLESATDLERAESTVPVIGCSALYELIVAICCQKELTPELESLLTNLAPYSDLPFVHKMLGIVLHDQGKQPEAEAAFRTAIERNPRYDLAWNNLGIVLHNQGRQPEAEAAYRTAIEWNPQNEYAWSNLGNILRDQGRQPEAEAAYRTAIEWNSRFDLAWNGLGNVLRDQGKQPEAETAYRTAIECNSRFEDAWNGLGNVLQDQGKQPEAETAYRTAIECNPRYENAWNGLGIVLWKQGKPTEAEAAHRTSIECDPRHANAWNGLGIVLWKQGKPTEAEDAYRTSIECNPRDGYVWRNLGILLEDQGRPTEAEAAYHTAIECNPRYQNAWGNLGILLNSWDATWTASRKVRECESQEESLANGLAWFYFRGKKDLAEAEKYAREALELNPDSPSILHTAASILLQQQNKAEAMELARGFVSKGDSEFYSANWSEILTFFKEAFQQGGGDDCLEIMESCNIQEQWLPLYSALKAAKEQDEEALKRLAPEIRTPAEAIYQDLIKPDQQD